jgi:hypothetical protein
MSAGYFPMNDSTDPAKKLLQAADLVQSATRDVRDSVYSGEDGQFDNSASDGGSLALLELAVKLIRGEVHIRQHSSDCAVHNSPALPRGECDCGYEGVNP